VTAAQAWAALLSGTLITAMLTGLKFAFDAITGRRVRRVVDGEAELRLAEMVKRVAADEVETLTNRLAVTEAHRERDAGRIEALTQEVVTLKRERVAAQAEIENAQTDLAGLQRRIVGIIDDRDDLARALVTQQAWIAAGAHPPAPVLPEHLADVLPQWMPADGSKPPGTRIRPDATD
jgi:hypothetical protein